MKNPGKYLGNELKYVEMVLNSENWSSTSGGWNKELESRFSKKFNTRYGVALNSGTSTLHAALEAAGVGPGDEVITPALTVMMDTTSVFHANAIPVYVDIDPDTFNVDVSDIAKKITPRTKAILVVALYGLPCDMDPIMELANKHDLVVIEDNAQCYLSKYKGRMTGSIGHMASYSFENTKHLSCGEGGIVITNNEKYAESVRKTGGHGFKNLKADEGRVRLNQEVFQDPDYKRHDVLGWNYRLPEINAAVALAQLERIEELIQLRIDSANIFLDVMKDYDFFIPQHIPDECTHSYYTLAVKYEGMEAIGVSWKELRDAYTRAGGDGFYGAWSVPYMEPMMINRAYVKRYPEIYSDLYYEEGLCPVAEEVQKKIMQFKTNYRSLDLAREKATIFRSVIEKLVSESDA